MCVSTYMWMSGFMGYILKIDKFYFMEIIP